MMGCPKYEKTLTAKHVICIGLQGSCKGQCPRSGSRTNTDDLDQREGEKHTLQLGI